MLKLTILNICGKPDGLTDFRTPHAFDPQKIDVSGVNGRHDGCFLLRMNILSIQPALFSLHAILQKQQ